MFPHDYISFGSQLAVPSYPLVNKPQLGAQNRSEVKLYIFHCFHREAIDQKFSRKDGVRANQLMNAIAVAVSKLAQWFSPHMFRSLSIRTVMPADEHAAPKVSAAVIYEETPMITISDLTQANT